MVKNFLDFDCTVVAVDKNQIELSKIKETFPGKQLHIYKFDLGVLNEIQNFADQVKKEIGKIDILINNVGVMNSGKLFVDLSEQEIMQLFNVNTFSYIWLCKQFLGDMIESNDGHIVNVSSVLGQMGGYKLTDYSSSKFAVVGFSESLRVELKSLNPANKIVVSLVCPFHVKTPMFNGVEFIRLKWMGLSMRPEFVAGEIFKGIALKKELILIPKFWTTVFLAIKKQVLFQFYFKKFYFKYFFRF